MQALPQEEKLNASAAAARLKTGGEQLRMATLAGMLSSDASDEAIVNAVAGCMSDSSRSVRELAVVVLGRFGKPAASALTQALAENQPLSIRVAAACGLSRLGAEAAPAVAALCQCLESPDELLRWHGAFALSKIGRAAIASLRNMLGSSKPTAQSAAADALGWMGSDAQDAVRAIRALTSSPSPVLQLSCHAALIKMTGDSTESLPKMSTALQHPDPNVRRAALQRLGELREAGRASSSNILPCLKDPSSAVRAEAALALARVEANEPKFVHVLIEALRDAEPDVRANAGIALAHFGPAASAALPMLATLRNDKDPRVAAIATASIQEISGPKN